MRIVRKWWPLIAAVALILLARGIALEHWLQGFEDAESAADVRHYREKAARLGKSLTALERRVHVGDSLAALRPRVTTSIGTGRVTPNPAPSRPVVPQPPVGIEVIPVVVVDYFRDTATVTINDTAYVVPARVAEVVQGHLTELANADAMRAAADTVVKDARETVAAADTAIATAAKKRGFFRRLMSGSITVVCAAGGAGIGAVVGNVPGAIAGAGGGVLLCKLAR